MDLDADVFVDVCDVKTWNAPRRRGGCLRAVTLGDVFHFFFFSFDLHFKIFHKDRRVDMYSSERL